MPESARRPRVLRVRGLTGHAGEFGAEHGAGLGVDPGAAVDEPLAEGGLGPRGQPAAAIV